MKTPFLDLDWHAEAIRKISGNHRRSGLGVLRGRPLAGKRRFLANLPSMDSILAEGGSFHVFHCPPCGTDREILMRLGRKVGVEECRIGNLRSELLIMEKISDGLRGTSTLIINDSHRMTAALLEMVIGVRELVEDNGGSLAIILATTFSANHFLVQGLLEDEVSFVHDIPDLSAGEMLGCLMQFCPDQARTLCEGVSAEDSECISFAEALKNRNLGRVGLLAEFAAMAAADYSDKEIKNVGLDIVAQMMNECRSMEAAPYRSAEKQSELFFSVGSAGRRPGAS